MLNIIANDDQVIRREWIQYYDSLPQDIPRYSATGIDPAISTNQEADYTAMVSGRIYGRKKSLKIYILPKPVNEHLDSKDIQDKAKEISKALGNGEPTTLWVESVGYQKSIIEHLVADGFPAKEYRPYGSDKRARLSVVSTYIQSGTVVFPRYGAEALIEQMVGFGTEKHDDLSDAFCILVSNVIDKESNIPKGHHALFDEKLLNQCYQSNTPQKDEKILGIVIANKERMKSAIVMRDINGATMLLHDSIKDPVVLAQKVVEIALKHEVPLSYDNIFVEKTGDSQDLCKLIKQFAEGKYELDKYEWCQKYGIEMSSSPQFEKDLFADDWTRAYSKCAGWLEKGGKLLGHNVFDDLLYMTYTEQGGKRKMTEFEGFLEDGIDTSIPDALTMTFARDRKPVVRPTREELEEENEMMYPEIGI
jgi:predicted phage terminase large subunit-like protein